MTRRMRPEDLAEIAVPEHPALSPDGTRVAYVLRTTDADSDRTRRQLWEVETTGAGTPRQLTRGTDDTSPAWSPDGTRLAFLRSQDGPPQIWLLPANGGEPHRLTSRPLGAGVPAWSPDGTRLAFTAPIDAGTGDREGPLVTDRLDHQADGAGWIPPTVRSQVHVLDVDTRECRQLTHGTEHAGTPAWSPDGTRVAFTSGAGADSDLTYRSVARVLDVQDARATASTVGTTDGIASVVTWTQDGESLLVVGFPGAPLGHAHLVLVPLGGGAPTDLSASLDRNVMPGATAYPGALPQQTGHGDVLFCVRDRGCTHVYAVDPRSGNGGTARPVLAGPDQVVSGLSVTGPIAVVALGTATSYGELVAVDLHSGAQTVLTDHGAALAHVELFRREARDFTTGDGTVVSGWVVRDPERTGPQPLLLDIHGGPHNAWNGAADEVHPYHQELASQGWTVLLLNPRGSDGYGEDFYTAVTGAWGTSDCADFLEPVDQLVAEGLADPSRLAVTGYSYGGYMTCYLTAHDGRFTAAVAGGVVSDLVSAVGTSDAAHLLSHHELGVASWQDPDRYVPMSPLSRVSRVSTPTLILHGDADRTCPVGQAQQWFTALRERGVPARMVLYPGASHAFVMTGTPSHRLDYNRRVVDWVTRYAAGAAGPVPDRIDSAHWQRRLDELAARHRVVGAQLGILRVGRDGVQDDLVEVATGVLNLRSGTAATPESLFQIGSITKVWTATVAMQLVDEGLVTLDTPLVDVLPDLVLADPEVTRAVTLRHLLTHTSGIDGDIFTDTGRGDDCVQRYVEQLDTATQNHPLGATWSYCNSGYTLLGRVIEQLTGSTWDQALRGKLFTPLGLESTTTLPEEALLHAAAAGHVEEEGRQVVTPVWGMPRSLGPAGLVTAPAADVLAFARMHLEGGVAADGSRVLSEDSVALMADRHAELPDTYILGDSWGLGWIRFDWDGHRLIGHDGNTLGQSAFLRMLPEQGLAVTLLTNVSSARDLYEDLFREIFDELAGVAMPHPLSPPETPPMVSAAPHVGTYERASVRLDVLEDQRGAVLRTTVTGPMAELVPDPVEEYVMVPVAEDLFVIRPPDAVNWVPVTFYDLPTGERYVHFGARATPMVGAP